MLENLLTFAKTLLPVSDMIMFTIFGICGGSILNMIHFKLTTDEDIFAKQPKCGACGHCLHHLDMLPVIGYFRVRGRCRYCGIQVSKRHIVIELLGGFLGFSAFVFSAMTGLLSY